MPSRSNICSWLKRPQCRLAQIYSHNMPEQQNWPPHACPQAALPAAAPRAKGRSSGEPQRRRRQEVSHKERGAHSVFVRPPALPPSPFAHGTDGGQDHEVRTRKGEGVGRTSDRRPLLDREQSTSSAVAIFRKEVSDQTKYGLWIWFN